MDKRISIIKKDSGHTFWCDVCKKSGQDVWISKHFAQRTGEDHLRNEHAAVS